MKLALDAMGGDNAPQINVDGAKLALAQIPNLEKIYMVGDGDTVKAACEAAGIANHPKIEFVHAPEVVTMEESGIMAVRQKKKSSMSIAVDLVKSGVADAVLSAGNTGAAVAASTIKLRLLPGVERAGIISPLPAAHGNVLVSDTGANPDAKPSHMVGYAVMAALMSRYVYNRPQPRVGVMSNGTVDCKGSETSLATYALLDALNKKGLLPFEFVGNTEGHDLFEHGLDVAVTDGFTGNILLKCVESTAKFFAHTMKAAIKSSVMAMIGALGMSSVFKTLKKRMSADAVGGSPLIGVNGLSIIAHGSATGVAILNAIRMACELHENNVNKQIVETMGKINEALKEIGSAE